MELQHSSRSLAIVVMLLATLLASANAGPLISHSKFDNDLQKYQHFYLWLNHYLNVNEANITPVGDCDECPADCSDRCLPILVKDVGKLLIQYKTLYKIQPIDGEITEEVTDLMSMPRCDQKDSMRGDPPSSHSRFKRFTRLAPQSWDLRRTPIVTISFINYAPRLNRQGQEQVALECAALWAAPSQLVFQLRPFSQSTNIGIDFQFIDGSFNSLGRGQSPNYNSYSYLTLDSGENWKLRRRDPGRGPSLKWAMCHEMGHTLNLGHSFDRNAIMYSTGTNQDDSRLSNDDRQGIISLYGNSNGRTVVGQGGPGGQGGSGGGNRPILRTTQQPFRTVPQFRTRSFLAPTPRPTATSPRRQQNQGDYYYYYYYPDSIRNTGNQQNRENRRNRNSQRFGGNRRYGRG